MGVVVVMRLRPLPSLIPDSQIDVRMKWTREEVQLLTKRIYGNFSDERILQKVREMNAHLEKWDKSFLHRNARHAWAEVERLAGEINKLVEEERTKRITRTSDVK